MSIRLNKAIRELNIGLQTAVEFLEKRQDLGEVKDDPNFKLSDGQYAALEKAFKQDKEVKSDASKLLLKKPKEKKTAQPKATGEKEAANTVGRLRQQYKPLGKIDLDGGNHKVVNKPSVAQAETPVAKPEAVAVSPVDKVEKAKPEPVVQKTPVVAPQPKNEAPKQPVQKEIKVEEKAVKPVPQPEPKAEKQEVEPSAAKPQVAPKEVIPAAKQVEPAQKEVEKQDKTPFQTENERKILNKPKVNVLGKIDLNTINQSTRPKKKTKEERKKEREEKAAQAHGGERKKRVRINKERVDINAAANQQNQNRNGNKKNKKKNNRAQKPLEVDDEAVARQVKETLARLTSKSQNKKGAKYRKEKRDAVQEKLNAEANAEKKQSKVLKLTEFVTVSELATMMNISVNQVIGTLMSVGVMVSINQRLDAETINLVADEFGFKTEYVSAEVQEAVSEDEDDENDLVPRAPIVTVM